jgi:hypothetical protein
MRLSDAGLRHCQTKLLYRNHRLPPWLTETLLPRSLEPIVRFPQRTLLSRSAIRVCQPGPVAFHRAMTSAGRRKEINLRGFAESGRPPLLIVARFNISSVSSGNSSYSLRLMTCASTRARFDLKERRDARFFTIISLPHTKNVSIGSSHHVSHHNHSIALESEADHSRFAVVLASILNIQSDSSKYDLCILKIQTTLDESLIPLRRIEGDCHRLLYIQ